jgi:hypothetical protein
MSYRNIPDDFRRDYFDLRGFLEMGTHLTDDDGHEVYTVTIGSKRADEIAARLDATPRDIIYVQTEQGRFQIEVGKTLTITLIDVLGKRVLIDKPNSNQVELIVQRY